MNNEQVYPIKNFYDISNTLKFRNTQRLIVAVKQCSSFACESEDNGYSMKYFHFSFSHKEDILMLSAYLTVLQPIWKNYSKPSNHGSNR